LLDCTAKDLDITKERIVSYGRYNNKFTTKEEGGIDFKVAEVFLHPLFALLEGTPSYDVAIWKVEPILQPKQRLAKVLSSIQTVALARDGADGYEKDDMVRAVGWGYTVDPSTSPPLSDTLNFVDVAVIDNPACIAMYKRGYERYCNDDPWARPPSGPRRHCYAKAVIDATMCAGFEEGKRDACGGDSGGPLLFGDDDKGYTVVGITSWGDGCAKKNRPGVYARVSYFSSWIETIVKKHAVRL
jgi:secreted trypsin-like serine protease